MNINLLKTLKILIVEDESKLASLLKEAIGEYFHSVVIAKDGEEGFKRFKANKPDIIITDIMRFWVFVSEILAEGLLVDHRLNLLSGSARLGGELRLRWSPDGKRLARALSPVRDWCPTQTAMTHAGHRKPTAFQYAKVHQDIDN